MLFFLHFYHYLLVEIIIHFLVLNYDIHQQLIDELLEANEIEIGDDLQEVEQVVEKDEKENNLRKILNNHISKIAKKSKQGFSHDFDKWTDDVGVPFISKYKKDFEFVSNFQSNFHNNNNFYLKSRATWSIYSILKWIEINKVSIK